MATLEANRQLARVPTERRQVNHPTTPAARRALTVVPTPVNGQYVTRAELDAHLRGLREHIGSVKEDVHEIREDVSDIRTALGAGPRWAGARINAIVDKILPALIALGAAWMLAEKL